jgi:hypothetical protein
MTKQNGSDDHPERSERPLHHVRLPGFVVDEDIGLGDVIQRTTSYLGIQPCGGCDQRRAALNRWIGFTGGRRT